MISSMRSACRVLLASTAALFLMCSAANATVLYSGAMTVLDTDPTQLGRLSRSGVPSDWSEQKLFPGIVNATTSYHYTVLDLDLGALEASYGAYGGYIQISFDSTPATTFLSTYLGAYLPGSLSTNYLGDVGSSGNYFGVDPEYFQVIVPTGNHLLLVMNETTPNGGLNLPGNVLVEAFLDTDYTELPVLAPVPEPSTWALLVCGMVFVVTARRARSASASADAR